MSTTSTTSEAAARHEFKAETARLLHLLIHSVYSERDIFLRELISNAADACEKLRYEALQDDTLLQDDREPRITIMLDKEAGTLSVADNGIGMSADELIDNLGVIARSGTKAFLDKLQDASSGNALIGQFGVGFYAAFMVARDVEVISCKAGSKETNRWHSEGAESFTVTPVDAGDGDARTRGTLVRLHLNDDAKDLLDGARIERIIKTYSGHVPVPIELADGGEEARRVGDAAAIWRKARSEIDEAAYQEFYHHVSGQFDEPALTIHYRAEGRHEYAVLLFVPSARPLDLFDPERRGRLKLYVRRVFITDQAELLPGYLRFMRGVIDSEDMPLNISREMLQHNPLVAQIRKAVTNRVLGDLVKFADKEPDAFIKLWETFGAVLKEGIYEDMERRDDLFKLARFKTSTGAAWRSLADYVADLKDNQTAIYYATGESLEQLEKSPQLEGFRARNLEVLLLTDPVDAFWTATAAGFDGKPFRSIAQAGDELASIPLPDKEDGGKQDEAAPQAAMATLLALAKDVLDGAVSEVKSSTRLVDSAACLTAGAGAMDRRLARMLARQDGADAGPAPVLELNPSHPLVKALSAKAAAQGKDSVAAPLWLLFDQARIADGEAPRDPAAFCARLNESLLKAL